MYTATSPKTYLIARVIAKFDFASKIIAIIATIISL